MSYMSYPPMRTIPLRPKGPVTYDKRMAEPLFGAPILEELKRDAMHEEDVQKALKELQKKLDALGVPFALLGALAMRHYGYVRHTEDIDILTTPEGLDLIHEKLIGLGISRRGPGLRKSLRDTEHKVNIDVIKTGEHAGAQDSPFVYPSPDAAIFVQKAGLRIPRLEALVEIKLVSGVWGHRLTDLGDVVRLIQQNHLNKTFARLLIPEVRPKFLELLEEARKEKKLE